MAAIGCRRITFRRRFCSSSSRLLELLLCSASCMAPPHLCSSRRQQAARAEQQLTQEQVLHVLRAGSTPAPVDPLACLLQEAQRRHFELVTWSTECL